jgi:hypothetical protein
MGPYLIFKVYTREQQSLYTIVIRIYYKIDTIQIKTILYSRNSYGMFFERLYLWAIIKPGSLLWVSFLGTFS